ncbi:hypothetical protein AMC82_CH02549 [Rhizobium phaseoli]|nr:hypothetical protein AMC84_CH02557 [Rhizobium phaseoli]ANL72568.1 hypothetical protein AMC83_CH02602 [Rhizobium phaseoli]ANL79000.1 hypothetical protein AMC82_CH02549 [Rhizobium phaseoli]
MSPAAEQALEIIYETSITPPIIPRRRLMVAEYEKQQGFPSRYRDANLDIRFDRLPRYA